MLGALGLLAAIIRARETGEGCQMELAQSDAAAYLDWYRIETWQAYDRPRTRSPATPVRRLRAAGRPALAGMREGVRYQIYESTDGHVLFMASEQAFWKNFAEGIGRPELFEKWPGSKYADHAKGNLELQAILKEVFKTKTSAEWIDFGDEHNIPIAPVNTPRRSSTTRSSRTASRSTRSSGSAPSSSRSRSTSSARTCPCPTKAPDVGEHTDEVLAEVLGYDEAKIDQLRAAGTFGSGS